MSRSFIIFGETLVQVVGGAHMSGTPCGYLSELGLTVNDIKVNVHYQYAGVHPDTFGRNAAAEKLSDMAHATVEMLLVDYDSQVLEACMDESLANGGIRYGQGAFGSSPGNAGTCAPRGTPMMGYKRVLWSGNHFMSLNLTPSPSDDGDLSRDFPYRFRMCSLQAPSVVPLGTKRSEVRLVWECLPYADPLIGSGTALSGPGFVIDGETYNYRAEIRGSGAIIWDRTPDVSGLPLGGFTTI